MTVTTNFAATALRKAIIMGGKPSKGTPADRRLGTKPAPTPKPKSK